MEKLEKARTGITFGLGILAVVGKMAPVALIGQGISHQVFKGLKKLRGYGKNTKLSKEEISLSKYTAGNIEVTLSFGTITIPLESKIKTPT